MRAIRGDVRRAAVVDRELQKEVDVQNRVAKLEEGLEKTLGSAPRMAMDKFGRIYEMSNDKIEVWQASHDPLPLIETKPMNTNKTGLASLSAAIAELKAAQQQALSAGETLHKGISEAKEAANEYVKLARQVEQETAEAMAALGQISNGGPE